MKPIMVISKRQLTDLCLEKGNLFADSLLKIQNRKELIFNRERIAMVYAVGAVSGLMAFLTACEIPEEDFDMKGFDEECIKNGETFANKMYTELNIKEERILIDKDMISHIYACGAKAAIMCYMYDIGIVHKINSSSDKTVN
jgi:hypothetical protein